MKKIYRGMQNSAEDIQANFDEIDGKLKYSNVPVTYASGFRAYPNTSGLKVKAAGDVYDIVYGTFTNDADIAANAEIQVASIPVKYAPPEAVHLAANGSGSNFFMLSFLPDGRINMSRHRSGEGGIICPKNSWLTPLTPGPIPIK